LRVADVDNSEKEWKTIVTFDTPLQNIDSEKHVITNLTRFPVVTIEGNSVDSHLARAFLVKSPNVTIRNNRINASTQTAIKLGAELGWNESGPVDNVLIEDNYISGCGYDASDNVPSCITLSTEASKTPPFVNRNIVIRNNIFDSEKPVAILLKDGENITLSDNLFTYGTPNSPDSPQRSRVKIENCRNISIK
ncbi:MAG: right-handed parallel beta-helix repeat-containing protein, partial [Muribaculaceae bacterium]|nr:right-handed parallel beta-helix repeat-containing protein [Muribaculaceae bacterium]